MPARAALVFWITLAWGCGAKSGLEVLPPDAGRRVDAPPLGAAGDVPLPMPDVPLPLDCPPLGGFGYTLLAGDLVRLPGDVLGVSIAGDGSSVYLVAEHLDGSRRRAPILAVDGRGRTFVVSPGVDEPRSSRVAAGGGAFHFVSLTPDDAVRDFVERGGSFSDGGTTAPIPRPLRALSRPVWNGSQLVLVGDTGFEAWVEPFVVGASGRPWLSFGPASGVEAAAELDTGVVRVLFRGGDGELAIDSRRDGMTVADRIPLSPIGLAGRAAFGVLREDGGDQPFVLAGFADEDGERRMTVRRFREDGIAGGGFSAPMPGGTQADLSTAPPRGHRSGYGVAAADATGALFHGAGEDFVGDAQPLPIACDGESISVAPGPCGYVIACSNGASVSLALAVPPMPR